MKERRLKIGITGGIGSGKTTVCGIFEQLGVPVYYADERAKRLMTDDPELRQALRELFGEAVFSAAGELQRAYVARIVFSDPEMLKRLNGLVHPAVARDAERWHQEQASAPYTLKEAALLFESGSYRQLDRIIVVTAPRELRLRRVMVRDGVGREAVEARMAQQWPDEEKLRRADFVIHNDGRRGLIRQVWDLHRRLLGLAAGESTIVSHEV